MTFLASWAVRRSICDSTDGHRERFRLRIHLVRKSIRASTVLVLYQLAACIHSAPIVHTAFRLRTSVFRFIRPSLHC